MRAFGVAEVRGESMLPALRSGDRLVLRRGGGGVRAGRIVVARHPDDDALLIIKRAVRRDDDGWWLESDNQSAPGRQDSWDFGAVPQERIVAVAVARYWPRPARL